jgi:hypothetical protein
MNRPTTTPWIGAGLVGLPSYGLLLAYATLRPEPDAATDPDGWAAFVSSTTYLVQHLAANVIGPVLVILGTVALGAVLIDGRSPRLGLSGVVSAIAGSVLLVVPGAISTFATPAIGAAYRAGKRGVMELTFSPAFTLVMALGLLLAVVGNALLSAAIWRSHTLPRWTGATWAAGTLVFYVLGAVLGMVTTGASLPTQPVGAVLLAISGAGLAWSVLRSRSRSTVRTLSLAHGRSTSRPEPLER